MKSSKYEHDQVIKENSNIYQSKLAIIIWCIDIYNNERKTKKIITIIMKLFNYFINDSTSWFIDLLKTTLKETGVKKEKVEKMQISAQLIYSKTDYHNWVKASYLYYE